MLSGDGTAECSIYKSVICAVIRVVDVGARYVGQVCVLEAIPSIPCYPPVREGLNLSHVDGECIGQRLVVRARKVDGSPERVLLRAVEHSRDVTKIIAASIRYQI